MVKAGRKGMLALGLAVKGTYFSTCWETWTFLLFSVFLVSLL